MLAYPYTCNENGMFEIHVSISELEVCPLAWVSYSVMCTYTYLLILSVPRRTHEAMMCTYSTILI